MRYSIWFSDLSTKYLIWNKHLIETFILMWIIHIGTNINTHKYNTLIMVLEFQKFGCQPSIHSFLRNTKHLNNRK